MLIHGKNIHHGGQNRRQLLQLQQQKLQTLETNKNQQTVFTLKAKQMQKFNIPKHSHFDTSQQHCC